MVLDTVTSLGGCPVRIDDWQIDAVYSGTQKCLSCPPGLSPVSFSRARWKWQRSAAEKCKAVSRCEFARVVLGQERVYHHTAPITMNYALHEALRLVLVEGLEARWKRHQQNHELLKKDWIRWGCRSGRSRTSALAVERSDRAGGADEAGVRKALLNDFGIEIGAGLGPMKGKIWRIGLMGETSKPENVEKVLGALKALLRPSR
jgi:alanine-glyoxylate transaminase/serine-glyoxylate transaminase/serine-pyruvate transaminase